MSNISTIIDGSDGATATVIFAHGAGADKSADFMAQVAQGLNRHKLNVVRFNFPYMDKRLLDGKRYPPNRMPKLIECLVEVVEQADKSLPIFLMGKSMGGRVSATFVEEESVAISGVICLGYPFHPQKQPEKLRLEPLQQTTKPILIVQGERDALGSKSEIKDYQLSSLCQIQFLPDGDHNLKPRVKSGFTHQQHIDSAIAEAKRFIDENS